MGELTSADQQAAARRANKAHDLRARPHSRFGRRRSRSNLRDGHDRWGCSAACPRDDDQCDDGDDDADDDGRESIWSDFRGAASEQAKLMRVAARTLSLHRRAGRPLPRPLPRPLQRAPVNANAFARARPTSRPLLAASKNIFHQNTTINFQHFRFPQPSADSARPAASSGRPIEKTIAGRVFVYCSQPAGVRLRAIAGPTTLIPRTRRSPALHHRHQLPPPSTGSTSPRDISKWAYKRALANLRARFQSAAVFLASMFLSLGPLDRRVAVTGANQLSDSSRHSNPLAVSV